MVLPLVLYTDDTSGNRSRKWNKFDLWCLKFAGLPWKVNSQLHNIHFLACSNQVSALEMAAHLVDDLLKLENGGVVTYDAYLQQEVLADNPRASELCNHQGSSARLYCRICKVSSASSAIAILLYVKLIRCTCTPYRWTRRSPHVK